MMPLSPGRCLLARRRACGTGRQRASHHPVACSVPSLRPIIKKRKRLKTMCKYWMPLRKWTDYYLPQDCPLLQKEQTVRLPSEAWQLHDPVTLHTFYISQCKKKTVTCSNINSWIFTSKQCFFFHVAACRSTVFFSSCCMQVSLPETNALLF